MNVKNIRNYNIYIGQGGEQSAIEAGEVVEIKDAVFAQEVIDTNSGNILETDEEATRVFGAVEKSKAAKEEVEEAPAEEVEETPAEVEEEVEEESEGEAEAPAEEAEKPAKGKK